MKIAIFGDVGGHYRQFLVALHELGCENAIIPSDTVVIQVGDLIHRGPESRKVVMYADVLIRENPSNYIQLLGNHEGNHLGGEEFSEWNKGNMRPYFLEEDAVAIMESWVEHDLAKMAVALDTTEGDVLVTHAGVSPWLWTRMGRKDARSTAVSLNAETPARRFQAGTMLGYRHRDAGCAWTATNEELLKPWDENGFVPFSQVHGHSGIYNWNKNVWYIPKTIAEKATLFKNHRHSRVDLHGKHFWQVDQALGQYTNQKLYPLILEGEVKW